jgi:Gas vesicle protein
MSDPVRWTGQMPSAPNQAGGRQPAAQGGGDGTNLADILERVLDKGIVIAGDVQINLLDIELLTIKLRLIVASVDRAKEMGIDWWERDPTLSSGHSELEQENRRLRERLEALEGRNGQAALEGDDEPDDVEDEDAELVDAEIVDDTEEPEPQPARRPKQTARQGGGGKAAPCRRRKAEE